MLNDFLSPFNLLFYFWVLPLLVSTLNWSGLQTGLSLEAIAIILVCTLILISISIIPMRELHGVRLPDRLTHIHGLCDSPFVKVEILCLYSVALVAMYYAEFSKGIPIFTFLAEESEDAGLHLVGKDSKLQVLAQGLMIAGALCFYVGMYSKSKLERSFFIFLAFVVPLLGVLKASKSGVFTPALYYIAIYYYLKKARGEVLITKRAVSLVLGGGIIMTSITMIRVLGVRNNLGFSGLIEFRYADDIVYPLNEIIATLYGYCALGFQNFSNFVDYGSDKWRIGTSLFHPFFSAFMQGDVVSRIALPRGEWHVISDSANIGTYLRDLYMEGGVVFCLLGSLIYSSLINWLYVKFRRARGGVWLFVYVIMLFPWVWIFFQNAFSILIFYTNIFYVCAIFALWKWTRGGVAPHC